MQLKCKQNKIKAYQSFNLKQKIFFYLLDFFLLATCLVSPGKKERSDKIAPKISLFSHLPTVEHQSFIPS